MQGQHDYSGKDSFQATGKLSHWKILTYSSLNLLVTSVPEAVGAELSGTFLCNA